LGRAVDRYGERHTLSLVNIAYVVALVGFALANTTILACVFYFIYAVIAPVSYIGGSTYLRKICAPRTLQAWRGITISHARLSRTGSCRLHLNFTAIRYRSSSLGVAIVAFFVPPRLTWPNRNARQSRDQAAATPAAEVH
jgi:hypothetical protein